MKLDIKTQNDLCKIYEAMAPNRFDGIDPQRTAIIKKAEEKMSWAIKNVGLTDVFFAGILDRMIPNNTNQMINFSEPTMSTDGKSLYYNPKFVNTLPLDAVETVIVHEILHVAFGHHLAFADIDPKNQKLWELVNIACDLSINHLLQDRSGFFKGLLLAGRGEFHDLPKGKDARVYFDMLLKRYSKPPQATPPPPPPPPPPPSGQPQDQPEDGQPQPSSGGEKPEEKPEGDKTEGQGDGEGEGQGEGEGGEEGEGEGEGMGTGTGEGKPTDKQGKGGGTGGKPQPQPTKPEQGKPSGGTPTQDDIEKNLNIPEHIVNRSKQTGRIEKPKDTDIKNQNSKIESHETEIEKEVVEAERDEAERQKQGIVSAGYGGGSNKFTTMNYRELFHKKSSLPWNSMLLEFLTNVEKTDRSYQKPSRRFSDYDKQHGIIMPGYQEETLKELAFLVDVSGSMPKKACEKIFGEIAAISKSPAFGATSVLRLLTFDDGLKSENIFANETSNTFMSVMNPRHRVEKKFIHRLPMTEETFKKFQWVHSQGGTQIMSALDNIKKYLYPHPAAVVILTDGGFYGDEPNQIESSKFPFKLIWLMTTDVSYSVGKTYHLQEYDYDLR